MPRFTRGVLCCVLVGAAGAVGSAQFARVPDPQLRYVRTLPSEQLLLAGEVTGRSDIDFTILSRSADVRTLRVTETTTLLKGAEPIELSQLAVGDRVSASTTRAADGTLQAVYVTVRSGDEYRLSDREIERAPAQDAL